MFKRKYRSLCAIILSICFIASQTMNVYALTNTNTLPTTQQLGDILDGIESIVIQLEELGLSETDINELFQLSRREDSFYTQSTEQAIPYNGSFERESVDYVSVQGYSTMSYSGNLPDSDTIQKQRIENIYGVALQYFNSDYYEGNHNNGTDFGNYLTYLYLSHYIDGPGRAPTQNDLPYIISTSDISAYNTFLNSAHLSNWSTAMANVGATLYSNFEYVSSIYAINTVDQAIARGVDDSVMAGVNGYNTASTLTTVVPMIKTYFVGHYATASNEDELTQGTLDYVNGQLNALNYYENFDENITNTIVSIMITTFASILCNSISLIGFGVSLVPLFVYECTGLIQTAVLVSLQYSFSGRYAIRTGIYLGL